VSRNPAATFSEVRVAEFTREGLEPFESEEGA